MRAVVYCRYSCEKQNEMSIDGQMNVCTKYAEEHKLDIVGTYIDRAISGRTDERPQFLQMIKDSKKHLFDVVLVYKLDRFSRDKYQSAIYRNELKKSNVMVMSAMENIPNTPEGVLLESVLEGLNQYYSMELSQKIHRSLTIKHERQEFCGGKLTYGYEIIDKKICIKEDDANVVRLIYKLVIDGIEPIDVKTKLCFNGSIQKVIRNERYKGKNCPAIISEDDWILANDILDGKTGTYNHKRVAFNYKLSGKVICGICGHHLNGGSAKSGAYRYYECRHKCGLHRIESQELEDLVVNAVMDLITDEQNLNAIAKECVRILKNRLQEEINTNAIKKRIDELNKQRESLIELYMDTKSKYINAKLLELDEEQEKLEKELYATNKVRASVPLVIEYIRKFKEYPPESLRDQIFNEIVKVVKVFNDKIEIVIGDLIDKDDSSSFEVSRSPLLRISNTYIVIKIPRHQK